MISVNNITKSFGDITAVDDLSFDVNEGEIIGLLGPNGAGKSTTMRIMAGYLAPDTGDVILDDVSVLEDPIKAQKNIGYLPENNPLYKEMLVSELLNISARIRGMPTGDIRKAIDFAVKAVNISSVYYRPVGELSKGFKQRVGIALALLHDPKILIMDEPTEGLDPNQRGEIRKLIKDLAKDHTVIVSTHVMQEVEALCSRMIIINQGKKVADGSVTELSRMAKNEKFISMIVEGSNVKEELSALKNITSLEFEVKNKMISAVLTTDLKTQIQPEISKLAHKNKWTIWEILEQKQDLEDLFKKLTEGTKK
jgi:ABC-2 type transport system ATP-binding protein